MAYDPNDAADKKIVKDLIAAALAEAETEHEVAIKGLKDKNTDLLAKLAKAKTGENDPEAIAKLENQLENTQTQLKEVQKAAKQTAKQLEEITTKYNDENKFSESLIVDGGLSEHLTAAKVAPEFLPAVKALIKPQVTLKVEGNERKAFVGEKPLAEHIKEWSQGDQGKAFISAAVNGGTFAPGGSKATTGNGKTISRSEFDANAAANPGFAREFLKAGNSIADAA